MARFAMAAVAALCALAAAIVPVRGAEFITVLTGGTSGLYYPLGVALTRIWADKIPELRPSVQATRGSVENLELIQQGKGEIAFAQADTLVRAWEGKGEADFPARLGKLRAVAGIYPNYIQIVASKESGIRTLADLRGKRLSVGAPSSGTELTARAILGAAGIAYADLGKVEYLPFAESVELMKAGQIDATLQSAGLGVASVRDLAGAMPVVMVEVPPAIVAGLGAPYEAADIPAGTYAGQDAPVATATMRNFLVTRADTNDDLIYEMTKALFENLPSLAAAQPAARAISIENAARGAPVPLHPGALRYYKERGIGL